MRLLKLIAVPVVLFASVAFAQKPAATSSAPPPAASSAAPTAAATTTADAATLTTATDVAKLVQDSYDKIGTYEADFTQTYTMKAFGETKKTSGHVTFVKDGGKMRWDYAEPKGNIVVSDGKDLWSYVDSDKAARKMAVKDSQMPTALSFLTGKGNLTADFNLTLVDSTKFKYVGGYVLEGKPKAATNLYNTVLFYIDAKTGQVRRVLIVDAQDNRNRFEFAAPAVNKVYDKTFFVWAPPAGATVTTQ